MFRKLKTVILNDQQYQRSQDLLIYQQLFSANQDKNIDPYAYHYTSTN